jgi:hypothetical protein
LIILLSLVAVVVVFQVAAAVLVDLELAQL